MALGADGTVYVAGSLSLLTAESILTELSSG